MHQRLFKLNFLKIVLVLFVSGLFFVLQNNGGQSVEAQSQSSDAIAIRIMPNQEHYSIARWYSKNFGTTGAPQLSTVDGYEAIRDGRSVYVNVSNVSPANILFTNIYLISFNQDAEVATMDIFSRILNNWRFNTNKPIYGLCRVDNTISCLGDDNCPIGDYCTSAKARIVRDTKRLSDISEIKILLDDYKYKNGAYPILSSGTYLPYKSLSVWPSWRGNFSSDAGIALPIDPINKIGACPGFDEQTCWDEKTLQFSNSLPSLPTNSLVYSYATNSTGTTLNFCTVFESGLVISGGDNIGSCADVCLDFDGDGYGSPACPVCTMAGFDCNDTDPTVTTGGTEDCFNGSDDDCDGYIDCYDTVDCGSVPICSGTFICNDDGICDIGETCLACPMDNCCACGNGVCNVAGGECSTCYGSGMDCNCGDSIICSVAMEGCDDGNTASGDGCSSSCSIETSTCVDNDGDGFNEENPGCPGSNDCNDNPLSCGVECYPGRAEICDGFDNNCDGTADNSGSITEENCFFVCKLLNTTYDFSLMRGFEHSCCGDDANEGNPYQALESLCGDGKDNDCDGFIDMADSDCSGFCSDTSESDYTNAMTPGICNQCGNSTDNDGDQTAFGPWTGGGISVDMCDSDCLFVATTVQPSDYEGMAELSCDGIDNNCDGTIDEGLASIFYQDFDGDGHGNLSITATGCTPPSGYVASSDDCNDNNNIIYPGAPEVCDGLDNNCVNGPDEGVSILYYRDYDVDTYGNPLVTVNGCLGVIPVGFVLDNADCNDNDDDINPVAIEICNNTVDENCNGSTNEGCVPCFQDIDGDNHGNPSVSQLFMTVCPGIGNYVSDSMDCNDSEITAYTGATEVCGNTVDEDCVDGLDNGCNTCYRDFDVDDYGDPAVTAVMGVCTGGWTSDNTDCDDTLNFINPLAPETCDGLNNNCNTFTDEGCDNDGDLYCDHTMQMYNSNLMCTNTTIYTFPASNGSYGNDCDDANISIHPNAAEICGDTIDQNCDLVDLSCLGICTDADGDNEIYEGTNISLCGPVCGLTGNQVCSSNNDCFDNDINNFNANTEICDDSQDNDCDGDVDCNDSDCPPCPNQCIFDPTSFPLSCQFTL